MRPLVAICCVSLTVLVAVTQVVSGNGLIVPEVPKSSKRPLFFSELKLRSVVEQTNSDLRQLKRDFMNQMTDIYLRMRMDSQLGYKAATEPRERDSRASASLASTMNMLIAEQFGEILVKRYVAQRRLLTGLKLAFVKFLPMKTLLVLYQKYKSFEWLRDQSQVDLRPKFANLTESQYVALYSLIELRARLRAADDVISLTTGNILRVLQVIQHYLVESKDRSLGNGAGEAISQAELELLGVHASRVARFYQEHILEYKTSLLDRYETVLSSSQPLINAMLSAEPQVSRETTEGQQVGRLTVGALASASKAKPDKRQLFFKFLDDLINAEALDIDLSSEANGLEFPPTINQQMIDNIQAKWIPDYVLKCIDEDRQLLLAEHSKTKQFIQIHEDFEDADIGEWISFVLAYTCGNLSPYGREAMFRR